MMTKTLPTLTIFAIIALTSSLAFASPSQSGFQGDPQQSGQGPQGGPPPGGGPREACMADAQTFCRGIQPGGGRIRDCLEDHYKEISDGCYAALKRMSENPMPPPPNAQGGPSGSNSGASPRN